MSKERALRIAERYGLAQKVRELENAILAIDHVKSVEFDLDGWLDNIRQVIIIFGYDVPVHSPDYFEAKRDMLQRCLQVTLAHGLLPSGDRIEDYGAHYYIVRNFGPTWQIKKSKGE